MDASWKPSIKPRSFYPPCKLGAQEGERNSAFINNKLQMESWEHGQHSPEVVRNGRIWRSRKETSTTPGTEMDSLSQSFEVGTANAADIDNSHVREELLFVRQRMIDVGGLGMPGAGLIKCISVEAVDSMPDGKVSKSPSTDAIDKQSNAGNKHEEADLVPLAEGPVSSAGILRASAPEFIPQNLKQSTGGSSYLHMSKRPSTDSVCSTADAQSDTTDEQDAASSSVDLFPFEEAAGTHGTLRASAPEFVPHDMLHSESSQENRIVSTPNFRPDGCCQVLSSTPVCGTGISLPSNFTETGFPSYEAPLGLGFWGLEM